MNHEQGGKRGRRGRKWRIVLGIFVCIVLLVVLAWNLESIRLRNRLEAEVESYRQAGQPVSLADLKPAPLEPEENIAATLVDAQRLLKLDPQQKHIASHPDARWFQEQPELVRGLVEANAGVLVMVRSTSGMTRTDWGLDYSDPELLSASSARSVVEMKDLARFLASAGYYEAQAGQDEQSIVCIADMLRASHAVGEEPLLVRYLVGVSIQGLAYQSTEGMLPHWDLSDPQARQAAEQLLAQLRDESDFARQGQRAWWAERAFMLGSVDQQTGRKGESTLFVRGSQLELARHVTAVAEAVTHPSYVEAARRMPVVPKRGRLGMALHPWSMLLSGLEGSYRKAVLISYSVLAQRRLAAVALAAAMFQADHGRPIASLAELVPTYLTSVPTDPFSPTDQPLQMAPDAPARAYSVGLDKVDGKGTPSPTREQGDVVFYFRGGREPGPLLPLPEGEIAWPDSQPASNPATSGGANAAAIGGGATDEATIGDAAADQAATSGSAAAQAGSPIAE